MDTELQQTDPVTVLTPVRPELPSDEVANEGGVHLVSYASNPDKVEVSVQTTSANTDAIDSDCEEEDALSPVLRDERRRMERDTGAILAWANTFLKQRGLVVKSLTTDFRDGNSSPRSPSPRSQLTSTRCFRCPLDQSARGRLSRTRRHLQPASQAPPSPH